MTAAGSVPRVVTAAAVGVLLWLAAWLSPILAPVGLGLFLATLSAPLFTALVRRGRSPILALGITVGLVLVIGGAIVVLGLVSARTLVDHLGTYSADLEERSASLSATLASMGLPASLAELLPEDALSSVLRAAFAIVADISTAFAFATVLAALLLLDSPRITRLLASGVGGRDGLVRQGQAAAVAAITYFGVRIRVNLVTAGGLLVLMLATGVDAALLWAVGAFFLSFVPYVGLVIALVPPAILAWAESGPVAALVIVIGGAILNVVAENVLEPTLTGRALRLSTWLVFAMFFLWVWLLGPVGALLAMPMTVLVVLLLRAGADTRWIAALITRDDAPSGTPGPDA